MAKTKKKATKSKKRLTQGKRDIESIITFLTYKLEANDLCDQGQERLKWWKRNGRRFASVEDALKTWNEEQIVAWTDFLGNWDSPSSTDLSEAIDKLCEAYDKVDYAILDLECDSRMKPMIADLKAINKKLDKFTDTIQCMEPEVDFSNCRIVPTQDEIDEAQDRSRP